MQIDLPLSRNAPLDIILSSRSIPSRAIRVLNTLVSPHSHHIRSFSARLLGVQGSLVRTVQPDTLQPYLFIPLSGSYSFSLTLGTTIEHLTLYDRWAQRYLIAPPVEGLITPTFPYRRISRFPFNLGNSRCSGNCRRSLPFRSLRLLL